VWNTLASGRTVIPRSGPVAASSFRRAAGEVLACVLTLAPTIESG